MSRSPKALALGPLHSPKGFLRELEMRGLKEVTTTTTPPSLDSQPGHELSQPGPHEPQGSIPVHPLLASTSSLIEDPGSLDHLYEEHCTRTLFQTNSRELRDPIPSHHQTKL